MQYCLFSKPQAGNFPCYRYQSIQNRIKDLKQKDPNAGKTGGTIYSSFINLSEMKMFIIPKLDNSKLIKLDLKEQFTRKKKQKIKLY